MRQHDIIEAVTEQFSGDDRVKGLFLSGSYGNGTEDAWSDVDFLLVVDKEEREAVIADFLQAAEGLAPLISSNRMEFGALIVHNVLEDWTRFDVVAGDERALTGKTQDGLKVLFDPADLRSGLPATAEWKGPDPQRVHALVKEYTRILGLTSVGCGREDYATLVMGCGLLHTNLVALMTLAVPMVDTGGILHNRKIFHDGHYQALMKLPPMEPDWEAIVSFNKACSGLFYPLARELTAASDGEWPEGFVEATRAHLIEAVGSDLIGD